MNLYRSLKITAMLLFLTQAAQAAPISYTEITASTSLVPVVLNPGHPTAENTLSIDEIVDGISADLPAPYAGFVTTSSSGTIRLDFNNAYDLALFRIFNDVFVSLEGIKDFRLDFFGAGDSFISSFLGTAANATAGGQEFTISADNVLRVDLVVLNSHVSPAATQIEIREVEFNGTLSNTATTSSVPIPTSLALLSLGLAGLSYSRKRKAY